LSKWDHPNDDSLQPRMLYISTFVFPWQAC
jgi:hypothetical protein